MGEGPPQGRPSLSARCSEEPGLRPGFSSHGSSLSTTLHYDCPPRQSSQSPQVVASQGRFLALWPCATLGKLSFFRLSVFASLHL